MATVTLTLPAPLFHGSNIITWRNMTLEIPAALAAGDQAIILRSLDVTTGDGRVSLSTATTTGGDAREAGPDLSDAFEQHGTLTLTYAGTSAVVPSEFLAADQTEPYVWQNQLLQAPLLGFYNAVGSRRAGATITFDDGQTPLPLDTGLSANLALNGALSVEPLPPNIDTSIAIDGALDGTLGAAPELGPSPLDTGLAVDGGADGDLNVQVDALHVETELSADIGVTGTLAAEPSLGPSPLDTGLSVDGRINGALAVQVDAPHTDTGLAVDGGLAGSLSPQVELGPRPQNQPPAPTIANEPASLTVGETFNFDIANEGSDTTRWVADKGLIDADGRFVLNETDESIEVTVQLRAGDTVQEIPLQSSWFGVNINDRRIQWRTSGARPVLLSEFTGNITGYFRQVRIWADGQVQINVTQETGSTAIDLVESWENGGWLEVTTTDGDGDSAWVRVTNTGANTDSPYIYNPVANADEAAALRDLATSLYNSGRLPSGTLAFVLPDGDVLDTKTFMVHPAPVETGLSVDIGLDGALAAEPSLGPSGPSPLDTGLAVDTSIDGALAIQVDAPHTDTGLAVDASLGVDTPEIKALAVAVDLLEPLDTGLSVDGALDGTLAVAPELGEEAPPLIVREVDTGDGYAFVQATSPPAPFTVNEYGYILFQGATAPSTDDDGNWMSTGGVTAPVILISTQGLKAGKWSVVVGAQVDGQVVAEGGRHGKPRYSFPSLKSAASVPTDYVGTFTISVAAVSSGDIDTLGPTGVLDTTARRNAIRAGSTSHIYSDVGQTPSEQDTILDLDAVFEAIENIFITNQDERLFNLDVTANLRPLLFQRISDETANEIRARSIRAIARWEPRVHVVNALSYVAVNRRQNGYDVDFVFNVEGFDDPKNYQAFVPRSV